MLFLSSILWVARLFQEEAAAAASGYDLQGIIAIALVVTFVILMAGWYMGLATGSAASILGEAEAKSDTGHGDGH